MVKSRSIPEGPPETYEAQGLQQLWRAHSDSVNKALVARWRPAGPVDTLLKTDLFDEAVSDGLSPLLDALAKRVFYMDSALEVHEMAKDRYPCLHTVGADVRHLPFADGTFDGIVSNSTLDHFEFPGDLSVSLQELYRVLDGWSSSAKFPSPLGARAPFTGTSGNASLPWPPALFSSVETSSATPQGQGAADFLPHR